tara:strand:- start:1682 stop:2431 length:750 start_codon:yes stop_codon:yes gene_type:complete
MPYTREELENYQWYQDKVRQRRQNYTKYLEDVTEEQTDNEIRNHITDVNGVLLSFEDINEEKRLEEPFRRLGLERPDQNIQKPNKYPIYNTGQKFEVTIDTSINKLISERKSLPRIRLANAPNENLIEPKLRLTPDTDGSLLSPLLLTPSRKLPRVRTDGYTIELVNGDIIAPSDWNNSEVNTEEERVDNYLQVYYMQNNRRRQFPNISIFNSHIGNLLSSSIEAEIILIEKDDLDLIPVGAPMSYNVG